MKIKLIYLQWLKLAARWHQACTPQFWVLAQVIISWPTWKLNPDPLRGAQLRLTGQVLGLERLIDNNEQVSFIQMDE